MVRAVEAGGYAKMIVCWENGQDGGMERIQVPLSTEAQAAVTIHLDEINEQMGRYHLLHSAVFEEFKETQRKRPGWTASDKLHEADADVRKAIIALHEALKYRWIAQSIAKQVHRAAPARARRVRL